MTTDRETIRCRAAVVVGIVLIVQVVRTWIDTIDLHDSERRAAVIRSRNVAGIAANSARIDALRRRIDYLEWLAGSSTGLGSKVSRLEQLPAREVGED